MNNTPHCLVVMDKWAYNSVKHILEALVYRITYSNCLVLLVLLTKTSHSFIRYLIPLNITFKRPNLIVVKINHRSGATSVFPVLHYLLEFAQTHVSLSVSLSLSLSLYIYIYIYIFNMQADLSWWCHPTISYSVTPFSCPQYQGLFQWVSSSHQVAKVLELHLVLLCPHKGSVHPLRIMLTLCLPFSLLA